MANFYMVSQSWRSNFVSFSLVSWFCQPTFWFSGCFFELVRRRGRQQLESATFILLSFTSDCGHLLNLELTLSLFLCIRFLLEDVLGTIFLLSSPHLFLQPFLWKSSLVHPTFHPQETLSLSSPASSPKRSLVLGPWYFSSLYQAIFHLDKSFRCAIFSKASFV